MNATEAKLMTSKAISGGNIDIFILHLEQRIKKQAELSHSKVNVNYSGIIRLPNESERKAIRLHFENNGFTWIKHIMPPSNDPREHDWEEITW